MSRRTTPSSGSETAGAGRSRPPELGPSLASRRLVVRAKDVVFVKGIIEAHDGLAHVFAERGGDLTIAAPSDREDELDELVRDLARELGGIAPDAAGQGGQGAEREEAAREGAGRA